MQGFFGGGTSALGDQQQPFIERVNHVWQLADDMTWIKGRHSMKFGVDIRREAMKIAFINRPNGDLTFTGGITGNAAADFLLGCRTGARHDDPGDPGRLRHGCTPATSRTSIGSAAGTRG